MTTGLEEPLLQALPSLLNNPPRETDKQTKKTQARKKKNHIILQAQVGYVRAFHFLSNLQRLILMTVPPPVVCGTSAKC